MGNGFSGESDSALGPEDELGGPGLRAYCDLRMPFKVLMEDSRLAACVQWSTGQSFPSQIILSVLAAARRAQGSRQ